MKSLFEAALKEFEDSVYLLDSKNTPIIVVDVQPAYEPYISFDMGELCEFLNNQKSKILMYVNAEETGITEDNIHNNIIPWWNDHFYNADLDFDDVINRCEFFDKGYGYLRGWMDTGVDDAVIIRCIREMYSQKVHDSRDLFGGEESDDYIENMLKLGLSEENLVDSISVGWVSVAKLKEYSGCYIMGGGKNECLREIELLMNSFNIKYKRVSKFVY